MRRSVTSISSPTKRASRPSRTPSNTEYPHFVRSSFIVRPPTATSSSTFGSANGEPESPPNPQKPPPPPPPPPQPPPPPEARSPAAMLHHAATPSRALNMPKDTASCSRPQLCAAEELETLRLEARQFGCGGRRILPDQAGVSMQVKMAKRRAGERTRLALSPNVGVVRFSVKASAKMEFSLRKSATF